MKRFNTIAIVLILIASAGAVYEYVAKYEFTETVQAPVVVEPSKYEIGPADPQEILELVNAERKKVGVAPLVMHDSLNKSAQLKADDMWNRDYRSHFLPEDPKATLTLEMASYVEPYCESSGENFVAGYKDGKMTSAIAMDWWLNSPPHKAAILNPDYTMIGMGVSNNDIAVQRFCIAK